MTIDLDQVGRNEALTNSDKVQLASDRVHGQLIDYLRRREEIGPTELRNAPDIHQSLINPNPVLGNYGGEENYLSGNTLDFEDKFTRV